MLAPDWHPEHAVGWVSVAEMDGSRESQICKNSRIGLDSGGLFCDRSPLRKDVARQLGAA